MSVDEVTFVWLLVTVVITVSTTVWFVTVVCETVLRVTVWLTNGGAGAGTFGPGLAVVASGAGVTPLAIVAEKVAFTL